MIVPSFLTAPQALLLPCGTRVSWELSHEGLKRINLTMTGVQDKPTHDSSVLTTELQELNQAVSQALTAYFMGKARHCLALPLAPLSGTPFQRAVWQALPHIAYGQTVSYRTLTKRLAGAGICKPGAVRAVGQALAKNPLPIVLPCHRVITESGKLGGYMGGSATTGPAALNLKQWLLDLEKST